MKKYQSYKPSKIDWIGEIPTSWEVRKFRFLFVEKKSTQNLSLNSGSISFGQVIYKDDEWIPQERKETYQEVLKGEFLINPLNLNFDLKSLRIGLSEIDVVVSPGYIVLKLNQGLNKGYFKYLLRIFDTQQMKSLGNGVRQTISFKHLSSEELVLPPLQEQHQIVQFLDSKTELIDKLISTKERKIILLKEQRTSLINQVVTKGLNPNVKMKDSGVEWIGEIPESWNVIKLKYVGKISSGDTLESSKIEPEGEYPVYGGNGIMGYYSEFNYSHNVLSIGRVGEKCGNVHKVNSNSWINDNSLVLDFNSSKFSFDFLFYTISSRNLNVLRNQNTQPLITGTIVKNEYIPLIGLDEQIQIVEFLDSKTKEIDDMVQSEQKKIDLLKEYRQSLISEVVTGKIKVTE